MGNPRHALSSLTGESEVQRITTFVQSIVMNPAEVEGKARLRFLNVEVRIRAPCPVGAHVWCWSSTHRRVDRVFLVLP
jgi:hypothetical protein